MFVIICVFFLTLKVTMNIKILGWHNKHNCKLLSLYESTQFMKKTRADPALGRDGGEGAGGNALVRKSIIIIGYLYTVLHQWSCRKKTVNYKLYRVFFIQIIKWIIGSNLFISYLFSIKLKFYRIKNKLFQIQGETMPIILLIINLLSSFLIE